MRRVDAGETRRTASAARAARTIGRNSSAVPDAAGLREPFQQRADVLEARQRKPSVAEVERDRLAGLLEERAHRRLFTRRSQRQNRRPAGRRSSQSGNETEDDVELEGYSVGAASVSSRYGVARFSSESLRSIFLRAWIILRFLFALGFS